MPVFTDLYDTEIASICVHSALGTELGKVTEISTRRRNLREQGPSSQAEKPRRCTLLKCKKLGRIIMHTLGSCF